MRVLSTMYIIEGGDTNDDFNTIYIEGGYRNDDFKSIYI